VLWSGIVASVVFAVSIILSGMYSDRIGRRRIVLASCALSVPWGFALFPVLDTGSTLAFVAALSATLCVMGISYGPAGALLPEMFRTEYRYTGAGMAYALAAVLGGATAPILAAELVSRDASDKIGWMLAAFGVLSFVCTLALSETRNRAMESDQVRDIAGATVRS
jgi:MFS family permease